MSSWVEEKAQQIGDFAEDVGNAVGKAVSNIVNDPLPFIETLALTALGVPPMVSSAIVTGMNGGSPEDMIKASVVSSLGAGVTSNVSTALVDAGVNQAVAKTIGSAVSGGVGAELRGGDFTQGALMAGANTGFNLATDYLATEANTPSMNTDDLSYTPPESIMPEITEDSGGLPALDKSSWDVAPSDYSLNGNQSNVPTSAGGLNPAGAYNDLNMDSVTGQAPGFAALGGGSGLSAGSSSPLGDPGSFINNPDNVAGALGTVSGAGFTDASATPALGNPGSFINNPNVTGQPVIGTPSCNYNVNVPNVKLSDLLNRRSQVNRNIANSGYEVTGCSAIPWLDSRADMLKGKVYGQPEQKSAEDIYSRMDACLAREFKDRYEGVPQVNINPLGGQDGLIGGNFAQPSGYASLSNFADGGTTTCLNVGSCLNNDAKYMPKFYACNPDLLQTVPSQKRAGLTLKQLKHMQQTISPMGNMGGLAQGGLPKKYHDAAPDGHNPEFVTGLTGFYACGGGTGQSDDIPAMLHDGDYVMDADVVAALGDGSSKAGREVLEKFRSQVPHRESGGGKPVAAKIADGEYVFPAGFVSALGGGDNKAGAKILDGLREKLRAHKRSAPTSKIPPKAKSPLDYIEGAKG